MDIFLWYGIYCMYVCTALKGYTYSCGFYYSTLQIIQVYLILQPYHSICLEEILVHL